MINRGNQAYVLSGIGKYGLPDQEVLSVAKSVRRLKPNEIELAEGRTISLVRAKQGDTIAKLAQRSKLDSYAEDQLRLINNLYPDGEPTAGQWIKLIQ